MYLRYQPPLVIDLLYFFSTIIQAMFKAVVPRTPVGSGMGCQPTFF